MTIGGCYKHYHHNHTGRPLDQGLDTTRISTTTMLTALEVKLVSKREYEKFSGVFISINRQKENSFFEI